MVGTTLLCLNFSTHYFVYNREPESILYCCQLSYPLRSLILRRGLVGVHSLPHMYYIIKSSEPHIITTAQTYHSPLLHSHRAFNTPSNILHFLHFANYFANIKLFCWFDCTSIWEIKKTTSHNIYILSLLKNKPSVEKFILI